MIVRRLLLCVLVLANGCFLRSGFGQTIDPDQAKQIFGILPQVAENPQNPVTPEKVALGKSLYFERRLSKSSSISCNSCHDLTMAGADGLSTSLGYRWQLGPRNAPTVLNAALEFAQFWDGRAKDVEEQAKGPIVNPKEMAATKELVVQRLKSIPEYVEAFHKAFPGDKDPVSFDNVANAIAAFERTLLTPSRFDQYIAGNSGILTEQEKQGLNTFVSVGCTTCHNGVGVGGGSFQKFGVIHKPDWLKDLGRYEVTKNDADKYVFKVPSLRNVALTAPYFNDGSVWSLEEAVKTMAFAQLGRKLSDSEAKSIVTFLHTLSADPGLVVSPPILPASSLSTPKPMP
ncbi:Cytochrome c551 peroxidase [Methylacidimicrobium cyclopophantes]|uniref:Cytochrome c551 peroxidase n=1 Tax=Methylacidimicrobium cyclopophantes TaxID=1041766 RepID=A0A5E6MBQ5_9BACT|nr:cytochrome-c peroxidase [Methylacidimicrobium cyclopophantes]VVM06658.1 Cytochrome c551 peroxidase [Methylacidimicrobium cyclopophantes]